MQNTTKFCDKCGTPLRVGSIYCPGCGERIDMIGAGERISERMPTTVATLEPYATQNGDLPALPFSEQDLLNLMYALQYLIQSGAINNLNGSSMNGAFSNAADAITAKFPPAAASGGINISIINDPSGKRNESSTKKVQKTDKNKNTAPKSAAPSSPAPSAEPSKYTPPRIRQTENVQPKQGTTQRSSPKPAQNSATKADNPQKSVQRPIGKIAEDQISQAMANTRPRATSVSWDDEDDIKPQGKKKKPQPKRSSTWSDEDDAYNDLVPIDGGYKKTGNTKRKVIKISMVMGLAIAAITIFYILPKIF